MHTCVTEVPSWARCPALVDALLPTGDGQVAVKDANLGGHQTDKSIPRCAPPVGCCLEGDSRQGCKPCRLLRVMKLGCPRAHPMSLLPGEEASALQPPLAIRRVGGNARYTLDRGKGESPGAEGPQQGPAGDLFRPPWLPRTGLDEAKDPQPPDAHS